MKTLRLFSAAVGLFAAGALRASDAAQAAPRTEVIFDHPENFTDVRDGSNPTDRGRDAILGKIRDYLVNRTAPLLPEGGTLKVTFSDIHLAGDFEPWRGAQWSDVRIIRSIYPPAFKFTYSVTDLSGKVLKEGSEDIRDVDFQLRTGLDVEDGDPLGYEKQALDDWARSTLGGLRKR
jgi:hypothetical protein